MSDFNLEEMKKKLADNKKKYEELMEKTKAAKEEYNKKLNPYPGAVGDKEWQPKEDNKLLASGKPTEYKAIAIDTVEYSAGISGVTSNQYSSPFDDSIWTSPSNNELSSMLKDLMKNNAAINFLTDLLNTLPEDPEPKQDPEEEEEEPTIKISI